MSTAPSNRRRYARRKVNLPVRELQPEQHVMRATSLSVGGLFIPDASPRPVGARLLLEIDLLGSGNPLVVPARVVYSGSGGSARGFGLGLAFAQPQPELEPYLQRLPSEETTTEWYVPPKDVVAD